MINRLIILGGMDEFSWTLCSDHILRHNKQELHKLNIANNSDGGLHCIQEGDIIGVSFDHIQLKFYLNGSEIDCPISNIKGTIYPVLYGKSITIIIDCLIYLFFILVDDGAILDIILDNFTYPPPPGFDKIMLEQSLL